MCSSSHPTPQEVVLVNQHRTLCLVTAFVVALASPALAGAPLTLERHQKAVEKVAPPVTTIPGKTLCVCQDLDDPAQTRVGYLNSYLSSKLGSVTVNLECVYPVFNPLGDFTATCSIFQVIK